MSKHTRNRARQLPPAPPLDLELEDDEEDEWQHDRLQPASSTQTRINSDSADDDDDDDGEDGVAQFESDEGEHFDSDDEQVSVPACPPLDAACWPRLSG